MLLDDEVRKLKAREAEHETRAEHLAAEKAGLLATVEGLRSEVRARVWLGRGCVCAWLGVCVCASRWGCVRVCGCVCACE